MGAVCGHTSGGRRCLFFLSRKTWLGGDSSLCYRAQMTLKQQVHNLVEELSDDSPLLVEVREALRMNRALGEAFDDVREGRTHSAEDFMAKVQERWPPKTSV